MNLRKDIEVILLFILIVFFASCAEKFDLTGIDTGDGNVNIGGDTVYVQLKSGLGRIQ